MENTSLWKNAAVGMLYIVLLTILIPHAVVAAVFITGMVIKYIVDLQQELHDLKTEMHTLQQYKKMFFLPRNFTMDDVHEHLVVSGDTWYSDAFYTSPGGYKMYISVKCTYSYSRNARLCLSMTSGVFLMRGEHDEQLKWPCEASFTFQIISQTESVLNYTSKVNNPNVHQASDGKPTLIWEKTVDYITQEEAKLRNRDSLTFKIFT